ncbi:hypothetical protein Tco_0501319, partial [Tanacetum coccineum]
MVVSRKMLNTVMARKLLKLRVMNKSTMMLKGSLVHMKLNIMLSQVKMQ